MQAQDGISAALAAARPARVAVLAERPLAPWQEACLAALRAEGAEVVAWGAAPPEALDLALAFAPPPDDLAAGLRLGVWRFELGRAGSGARVPVGLLELVAGATTLSLRLVRLGPVPGRAMVLASGRFALQRHSLARTAQDALASAALWPAQHLRALRRGDAPAQEEVALAPEPPPCGRLLRWQAVLGQHLARLKRLAQVAWEEQWALGVVDLPIARFLEPGLRPAVRWLAEPRDGFLADPFGWEEAGGRLVVLAEELPFATRRGHLSALALGPDGSEVRLGTALAGPHHLSYPYLLHHDGALWCVPETFEAGRIALYRVDPASGRLEEEAVLIEGVPGVDATPFFHGGRWWILCTRQDDLPDTKLHGYHAPDLRGPWTPHPGNPLKCDIASARPAGTPFRHAGALYRPAQDCSRTYGGAVVLNRIDRLTPDSFAETTVARLDPDPAGPYPEGCHTLAAVGGRTLIDGKRLAFRPGRLFGVVRRRLSRGRAGLSASGTGSKGR